MFEINNKITKGVQWVGKGGLALIGLGGIPLTSLSAGS